MIKIRSIIENEVQRDELLKQYAEKIRELYHAITANEVVVKSRSRVSLDYAIEVGSLLNEVKDRKLIPHGQWEQWVEEHTEDSIETCNRYRRIAKGSRLNLLHDCQSLTDARRVIGDLKPLKVSDVEIDADENDTDTDPEPPQPGPETNGDTQSLDDYLEQCRKDFKETVEGIIEDENHVSWNVTSLRISRNGNLTIGPDGSGQMLLLKLSSEVSLRTFEKLKRHDEIKMKSEVVMSEIIKLVIRDNIIGTVSTTARVEPPRLLEMGLAA